MSGSVKILHITDPHLHAHREARMRGLNTYQSLSDVIARVREDGRQPDAILATGDLVQDETRQGYMRFRELMASFDVPVHCLPGNHDAPLIMNELLNVPPFQYCGEAAYSDWRIVLLNTASRMDDGGRLDANELLRLENCLQMYAEKHVLVCLHHHPIPMGSHWLDGIGLRNATDFLDIIDRHHNVRVTLWGHVHQASDRYRGKVDKMLSSPSTCSQFLPNSDSFALDTRLPGYRWLELCPDGEVDTEVVWLD